MKAFVFTTLLTFFSIVSIAQDQDAEVIPITTLADTNAYQKVLEELQNAKNALFVFDVDNTLLITNNNLFGSDWWYAQTKKNSDLKLNINNACLFDELTPLFYATYGTTSLFQQQANLVNNLGKKNCKTLALTSRGFTPSVGKSTDLELRFNQFNFMDSDTAELAKNVVYQKGVIYTKGQDKGKILLQYVQEHGYNNIYFFDDSYYKVQAVQRAFTTTFYNIKLYHVAAAPTIAYTPQQIEYMQEKLCTLIELLQTKGESNCACNNE